MSLDTLDQTGAPALAGAPSTRIRTANEHPIEPSGAYVLLWLTAHRRLTWSFTVQRAVEWALRLRRPLLVFEALRLEYPWASPRLHRFVIDGMVDNAARCDAAGVTYLPWVEPAAGAGRGLLTALAARACVVVTDDHPGFFFPRMLRAAAAQVRCRLECVDTHGVLPLSVSERAYPTAAGFRRALHRWLTTLPETPAPAPLDALTRAGAPRAVIPAEVAARWPTTDLAAPDRLVGQLPLHSEVGAVDLAGGERAARRVLTAFVDEPLHRYADDRSHPDRGAASGLSAYLHFGHLSVHEVVDATLRAHAFHLALLSHGRAGSRAGFWGLPPGPEAFLDELLTWRELGFVYAHHRPDDHDRYAGQPRWAQQTLDAHRADPRPVLYDLDTLAAGETHDPIWNAAANELRLSGRMHNALRMLWGKKILEWTPSPEAAFAAMVELNNRYALDGRDPNSYSGIGWVLGRFDRPWGPRRPIFGTVRYMSSESTRRKLKLTDYLRRWSG